MILYFKDIDNNFNFVNLTKVTDGSVKFYDYSDGGPIFEVRVNFNDDSYSTYAVYYDELKRIAETVKTKGLGVGVAQLGRALV